MNDLKTILELNPDYPPTESTWQQIVNIVLGNKQKPLQGWDKVRYSLLMETQALEKTGSYHSNTLFNGSGVEELPPGADPRSASDFQINAAPSLPEPMVIRFYYQDQAYYLDTKDQIYQPDPDQTLVAHWVGKIENQKVIIKDDVVHTLIKKMVSSKEVHGRHYYVGKNFEAYRGLLPKKQYICQVGKLNSRGKLELI